MDAQPIHRPLLKVGHAVSCLPDLLGRLSLLIRVPQLALSCCLDLRHCCQTLRLDESLAYRPFPLCVDGLQEMFLVHCVVRLPQDLCCERVGLECQTLAFFRCF